MTHLLRALCLSLILFCTNQALASPAVIAFAQDTMANDFRRAQVFAVRDEAARYPDLQFEHADAGGRTSLLIHQIGQFIDRKVDVLIVGTNDPDAVVPVVTRAHQAGIPVIILDRGVNTDQYTSFINSDNALIGRLAGEFIAEQLAGRGRVLLFEGLPKADVTQLRSQGFLEVMARHPEIEVIQRIGNFLRKDAIVETERLYAEGISVDAIFSESDSMLSGIRLVQRRYGTPPQTVISVGVDYIAEARAEILAGNQTASVLFPLGGKETVDLARRILAGEEVPRHISIPVRLITRKEAAEQQAVF